ncbi:MAG: DUF6507 family protein [Dermatophilaceae bacterium]
MAYTIRPQEVFGVLKATDHESIVLREQLTRASESVLAAAEGAPGVPAVVAALAALRAEHDRLTELMATRVVRATEGCRDAVSSYADGDQLMAEQFARDSAVLYGDPAPPLGRPFALPPDEGPLPDVLTGG